MGAFEKLAPTKGEPGNVYALRRGLLADIDKTFAGNPLLNEFQVRGALAMIPLPRAASLMEACNRFITQQLLLDLPRPDWRQLV